MVVSSKAASSNAGGQSSSSAIQGRNLSITLDNNTLGSIDSSLKLKLKSPRRRTIDASTSFALIGIAPDGTLRRSALSGGSGTLQLPIASSWTLYIEETWSGGANVQILTYANAQMKIRMDLSTNGTLDAINLGSPTFTSDGRLVSAVNPADNISRLHDGKPDSRRDTNATSFDNDGDGAMDCYGTLDVDAYGIPDAYQMAMGLSNKNASQTNIFRDYNTNALYVVADLAVDPNMTAFYQSAPVYTNAVVRFALDTNLMYYQGSYLSAWSNKLVQVALDPTMVSSAVSALPNAVADWSNAAALVATVPAFTNFIAATNTSALSSLQSLSNAVAGNTSWANLATNVVITYVAAPVTYEVAPFTVISACKAQLESGYLDSANDMCASALSNYPTDPDLNMMYALTLFSKVIGDTNISNFAASVGLTGLPTSFSNVLTVLQAGNGSIIGSNLLYLGQPVSTITNVSQLNTTLLYAKNVSDVQALLNAVILSRIQQILVSLNVVESVSNYLFLLDAGTIATNWGANADFNGMSSVWPLGDTEVYAMDATMSVLAAMMQSFLAINANTSWSNVVLMISNPSANSYNPFADPNYPNFLDLNSDGPSRYAQAKALLQRAAGCVISGYEYLTNHNNGIIPASSVAGIDIVTPVQTIQSSLNGNYVSWAMTNVSTESFPNDTTNIMVLSGVSLGKFFDKAPSPRSLFIQLTSSGEPVLYSYTNLATMDYTNYGMADFNVVTSPVQGSNYAVRWNDPTFGGLITNSTYASVDGIDAVLPLYLPVINNYNTSGDAWQNLIGAVPQD
jgi:hypothetical protein